MPSFWPEGKSLRKDILDGDTDRQVGAIWAYLSKGELAGLPPGLIQGKLELVATNEAILYRNFIAGAGSRAIGVGYPEKANLAWDANDLRLAMIWQGPFLDAARHRTGRGEGFEPPLGYNVINMPPGRSFGFLDSAESPWPAIAGPKAGFRMGGYSLDAERRPTFRYSFENIQVEDYPVAIPGELDAFLRRTLTLRSDKPVGKLWFRAWVGSKIEPRADGSFLADDKLRFQFQIGPSTGPVVRQSEGPGSPKPVIRQSEGHAELLVPVEFSGGEARIIEQINW